jgi:hypothetical protein
MARLRASVKSLRMHPQASYAAVTVPHSSQVTCKTRQQYTQPKQSSPRTSLEQTVKRMAEQIELLLPCRCHRHHRG